MIPYNIYVYGFLSLVGVIVWKKYNDRRFFKFTLLMFIAIILSLWEFLFKDFIHSSVLINKINFYFVLSLRLALMFIILFGIFQKKK